MNDLLQLKGTYEQRGNPAGGGSRNIPRGESISVAHFNKLLAELKAISVFWSAQSLIRGALLSIDYRKVAAKSNRIKGFLSKGVTPNSTIVGAKFARSGEIRHIITHFVALAVLNETIGTLEKVIDIVGDKFEDSISYDDIDGMHKDRRTKYEGITKTLLINYIVDSFYINKFFIDEEVDADNVDSIVTIYDTHMDTIDLMAKLGITISRAKMIGNTTILLTPDELSILRDSAPYLVSMAITDISELTRTDFAIETQGETIAIPTPAREPVVGVIDTMFDERVYFSEWVEFTNKLDPNIPLSADDYVHGTSVSSIIVDGPSINPNLNDGCGRFRVRHFGVASGRTFSSFTILKLIKEIVTANRDIKVWNLSLGSNLEIRNNSISPEAAILDEIQYKNDVIFVVAGTNDSSDSGVKRIGAPADSINSLVVNSVSFERTPSSYTRVGPVLSFFNKPDISCYGGDTNQKIKVCSPLGERSVEGTSFAAPWITRKMAYLVHILGLSREEAKALLIDSASGWSKSDLPLTKVGYGIVPTKIADIVKSKDDEIKIVLYGTSEMYQTYNYKIPVPVYNDKHPYIARATLCYFPRCERNQGVDYTSTEFNIKFGRVDETQIKAINNDIQDNPSSRVYEEDARTYYRKWDNVKHIRESYTGRNGPKKAYSNKMWGISITSKERVEERHGHGVNFGVVITMKEINGINRIDDFIQQSQLKGWLVNRINVDQRIDIYNIAEEDVVFDDSNR